MAKKYLSFLGTNDYIPCNYSYEGRVVNNVHYIQEALVELFCEDFSKNDKILIFVTDKAKGKNWESEINDNLLKNRLARLNIKAQINAVDIPMGNSEKEIWEIFSIIYNNINENDEIILDITHAFRSIPMLTIVLMNYTRFLKNITLKGIYYGAFEVLGTKKEVENIPLEKRNAPIFDLTSFDLLQQWSIAAENFVNYGITEKMCNLIYKDVNPILQNDNKNEQARNASNFAKELDKISRYFQTVRGKSIIEGKDFIYLKNNIENLNLEKSMYVPLKPLKEKIQSKIEKYKENNIFNGFRAVEWCIDNVA